MRADATEAFAKGRLSEWRPATSTDLCDTHGLDTNARILRFMDTVSTDALRFGDADVPAAKPEVEPPRPGGWRGPGAVTIRSTHWRYDGPDGAGLRVSCGR